MALRGRRGFEIESRQGVAKRLRCIFHVWRARADFGARLADGSCGDEGFVAVELEADPSHGGAQKARAGIVDVQGVYAAEIDGHGGGRIDYKFAGRRPDGGVNGAAFEGEALAAGAVGDQAETGSGVDLDAAGFIERDAGPRRTVGHKSLPNSQFSRS